MKFDFLKNKKAKLALIGASAILIGFTSIYLVEENKVLSEVGNSKIRYKDIHKSLDKKMDQLLKEYIFEDREELESYLDEYKYSLIDSLEKKLIAEQELKKLGIYPDKNTLKLEIESLYTDAIISSEGEKEFKQELKEKGMSKKDFEKELYYEALTNRLYYYYMNSTEISDEEVENYYNENISLYTKESMATLNHVYFDNEAESLEAYEELKNGKTIEQIALEKEQSYDLGVFFYDREVEEYNQYIIDVIQALGENEFSEPVKIGEKFHIFLVKDIDKSNKVFSLEEVKENIRLELKNKKVHNILEETYNSYK